LNDDISDELNLDWSKSKPNSYAKRLKEQRNLLVQLDPDVFNVFDTSDKVNSVLRAIINAIPKKSGKKLQKV
jgi:hypothetical protein